MIEQIYDPDLKKTIAREILEALREWFEVDESREKYIADCAEWIFFAAKEAGKYAGFLCPLLSLSGIQRIRGHRRAVG